MVQNFDHFRKKLEIRRLDKIHQYEENYLTVLPHLTNPPKKWFTISVILQSGL